jgi:two-component system chemotaxis response regulator CheB
VQDPAEAPMPSMPQIAIEAVDVDYVLPAARLALTVGELMLDPAPSAFAAPDDIKLEVAISAHEAGARMLETTQLGRPTTLCCPTCHGTLWEIDDEGEARYRCRTGHAFGPLSLNAAQSHAAEQGIIIALRTLDERAELYQHMAERARRHDRNSLARRWETHLRETNQAREKLREALRIPSLYEVVED